jgi:HK97 family phage major capsid protein
MKRVKSFMQNRANVIALVIALLVGVFAITSDHKKEIGGAAACFTIVAGMSKKGIKLNEEQESFFKELETQIDDQLKESLKGFVSADQITEKLNEFKKGLGHTLTDEQKKAFEDLQESVKSQASEVQKLKEKGLDAPNAKKSLADILKEKQKEIKDQRSAKAGSFELQLKAAGIQTQDRTTTTDPNDLTNPYGIMPTEIGDVVAQRRNPNFILNYVDVGATDSSVMVWTEEGNSEGDAAVTAEGAVKPLQDKKFVKRITESKKVAGHIIITEEMETNAPRLATAIRRLFQDNVMRKYDDQVYADLVAVAPGYTLTALDDQIENADDYAAIGAAICQIESLNGNPDIIALNPADKWRMRLIKGSDGHYVAAPFTVGNNTYDGIRVVISNKVAAGNFLVGESKTYKVDEQKGYTLRIGWQNDDFVKNQFTAVGEVWFHSYIATNDLVAWCYSSFATVKAAIEKP